MKNESLKLENVSYIDYRSDKIVKAKSILIEDGRIKFNSKKEAAKKIDCGNYIMTPSFVQIHTHICQHLYKGMAEDLSLFEWLKKHILPYEHKLTKDAIRLSCRMALYELIESGTTVILDMGTFRFQEIIMEEIEKSGITGFSGNILLDRRVGKWSNSLDSYLDYTKEMIKAANKQKKSHYALCPRFFPGITKRGINKILALKEEHGLILHTHASETREENLFAAKHYGKSNIKAMSDAGMLSDKTVIAHCIHLNDEDYELLKLSRSTVCHCPSSNMKLGSGIADIERMNKMKINTGLGSDGAPCNNNMNQLMEMRLCGLLQKVKNTSKSMTASSIFKMATYNGLKPLSLDREMGTIEDNKKADFILFRRESVHASPFDVNPFSSIIYSMYPSDIEYVFSSGKMLKEKGRVLCYDREKLLEDKRKFLKDLLFDRL
ncbi:MAG: amidohydrolase family protein [bacterium]